MSLLKKKFKKSEEKRNSTGTRLVIISVIVLILFIVCYALFLRPAKKPNIVILLIDTLRADHCSVYGYSKETTPHMKRMAQEGLILSRHFVNAPWTKPSVASIITGLYPTAHGSRIGQFEDLEIRSTPVVEVLNPKIDTMADILKKNGYKTHAYVTNYHMTPKFGYAQGYDQYSFDPDGTAARRVCRKDKEMVEETMEILRKHQDSDKPAFIWCHLMSVHGYRFPGEFDRFKAQQSTPIPQKAEQVEVVQDYSSIEDVVAHYDNSVLYSDQLVGRLFDFIKKETPNTLFIVTSDHGEEFYEHGGFEHSRTLYNELLKVPCIIWGKDVPRGVFNGVSDSIDLLPTIMKNLGIKINSDLRGQPLFYKNKITAEPGKEIFAEQHHRGEYKRFGLIWKGKKIILSQHKLDKSKIFELYNHAFSIEKEESFKSTNRETINRLKRKLTRYQAITARYFKEKIGRLNYKNLNKKDIEYLRSLGYIN